LFRYSYPHRLILMKLLLTGPPGIGKTTVIQKVLSGMQVSAGGFYTQEMREHGRRTGFSLRTLDGKEGVLAHIDYQTGYHVGRYGVDITLFEAIAIPALERALEQKELIVIDEIGNMELFSQRFQEMVLRILDQAERDLLGVIHQGSVTFEAAIKNKKDVEIITVNKANRDALSALIITRLMRERG
jgi:nucleoside-triphosphatase